MRATVTKEFMDAEATRDEDNRLNYCARNCPIALELNRTNQPHNAKESNSKAAHWVYPRTIRRLIIRGNEENEIESVKNVQFQNTDELTRWITNYDGWRKHLLQKRSNPDEETRFKEPEPITVELNPRTQEAYIVHE